MECAAIDAEWAAAKQLGQKGKRPPYPLQPKRSLKLKDGEHMGYPRTSMMTEGAGDVGSARAADVEVESKIESDIESGGESEAEGLVNSINMLSFH